MYTLAILILVNIVDITSIITTGFQSSQSGALLKPVKNLSSRQQITQQLKLNHGLSLDGYGKPCKEAVFSEDLVN